MLPRCGTLPLGQVGLNHSGNIFLAEWAETALPNVVDLLLEMLNYFVSFMEILLSYSWAGALADLLPNVVLVRPELVVTLL